MKSKQLLQCTWLPGVTGSQGHRASWDPYIWRLSDPTPAPAGTPRVGCSDHLRVALEALQGGDSTVSLGKCPISWKGFLSPGELTGLIVKGLLFFGEKKKIHTVDGGSMFYPLVVKAGWSWCPCSGLPQQVQGCLIIDKEARPSTKLHFILGSKNNPIQTDHAWKICLIFLALVHIKKIQGLAWTVAISA